MHNESTNDFTNLEKHFNDWLGSTDQTRTASCSLADKQIRVVFNQGHWIKPSHTIELKKDTVNVVTNDPGIKKLFEGSLKKLPKEYLFPNRRLGSFKLRFFDDMQSLEKKIAAENKYNERYRLK